MKTFAIRPGTLIGAAVLACVAGRAVASDVSDAESRVAEARRAYEAALAELRAAEAALAAAESGTGGQAAGSGVAAQPEGAAPPPETTEPERGFFDWDSWTKSIDIGVNGSSGNSENVNGRLRIGAERKTDEMETRASALYRVAKQDGETTENRFRLDVFNDWLPPEGSKIRWWAKGSYEFDEFQSWDHRVTGAGGFGYEFIDNEKHTLVGRLGFGGSQTFGGPQEEFRPEAIAGLDYVRRISSNQTLTASTEIYLDVSDTDQWRTESSLGYEAVIDESNGLNFKTGVTHRYDSEPGGDAKKSDLEYFATMGWTF